MTTSVTPLVPGVYAVDLASQESPSLMETYTSLLACLFSPKWYTL